MQRDWMEGYPTVWVFSGVGGDFPSCVFTTKGKGEESAT